MNLVSLFNDHPYLWSAIIALVIGILVYLTIVRPIYFKRAVRLAEQDMDDFAKDSGCTDADKRYDAMLDRYRWYDHVDIDIYHAAAVNSLFRAASNASAGVTELRARFESQCENMSPTEIARNATLSDLHAHVTGMGTRAADLLMRAKRLQSRRKDNALLAKLPGEAGAPTAFASV